MRKLNLTAKNKTEILLDIFFIELDANESRSSNSELFNFMENRYYKFRTIELKFYANIQRNKGIID